jgi:Flp pilus assembly protein TadD
VLARALLRNGASEVALAEFEQAISLDPEDLDVRAGRGAALSALRRYREALADFDFLPPDRQRVSKTTS